MKWFYPVYKVPFYLYCRVLQALEDNLGWQNVVDHFGPYNPLSRFMNGIQIETWSISKRIQVLAYPPRGTSSPSYFYLPAP